MDMKELYAERADEISWNKYNKDFYDLTDDQQHEVWVEAETDVASGSCDHADSLRKASRENG